MPTLSRDSQLAIETIRSRCGLDDRVIFISGNFNVIHPGHLRLLNFGAECGDILVVAVLGDSVGHTLVPAHLRLEAMQSIGIVDYSFLLIDAVEDFIDALRPDIVVKGKEHAEKDNPEQAVLDAYGGTLLFSSGDVRFSSRELLRHEISDVDFPRIRKPENYFQRHGLNPVRLERLIDRFRELRVVVLGDLIVDEYIDCEAVGMSQEDPTVVVSPIDRRRFVGGAGIVAAHARGLGADISYFTTVGEDETATFAQTMLAKFGVDHHFFVDASRPTTLKQRYRAKGKTMLRVNHMHQHDIPKALVEAKTEALLGALADADLLIFSDFNYGCVPDPLVTALVGHCRDRGIMMTADSQSSSQMGDVARFKGMALVTPTEREARLSVRDYSSGLVSVALSLQDIAQADNVILTLGSEGILVQAPDIGDKALKTDRLPALNGNPIDVAGAGDSLLTAASLALAADASIWEAAYVGSLAAACQVARTGNIPLDAADVLAEIRS